MNDELLFVVDEHDRPVAPRPRSEVIKLGFWRRTGSGMIVNRDKKAVLCQKRSHAKDERPGVWIALFGGKSDPGETAAETTLRELNEELGMQLSSESLVYYKKVKSEPRRQFEYLYFVNLSGTGEADEFNFDRNEVSEVAWRDIGEVIDLLSQADKSWYSYGYDIDMLKLALEK